jgi:hypothetical protein
VWFLPSYNRPEQCLEVVDRLREYGCTTPGIVIVNGDQQIEKYQAWKDRLPDGWKMVCLPYNIGMCGALRWAFATWQKLPFYGVITDDEFVQTHGWDKILIEAAGDWNLAHANNGDTSARWPHGLMTFGGGLVRAVGNLAPADMWHLYFDMYWDHIASQCGLKRFCHGVRIEEKHYTRGTAPFDATNQAAQQQQKQDDSFYTHWIIDLSEYGAMATVRRVKAALNGGKLMQAENKTVLEQIEDCYQRHFGGLQASEWKFIIRNFHQEVVSIVAAAHPQLSGTSTSTAPAPQKAESETE